MRIRFSLIFFLGLLSVSQISAQGSELPFKSGIYLAGSGHYSTVGGGFDGQSVYTVDSGAEVLVVPKINAGFGAGVLLGYRAENWGYEAGGYYNANGSSWANSPFDTSTLGFTFDAQLFPFARPSLQPYLSVGLAAATLTVKKGSTDGILVGDATYYLGGFRAGLGLEAWVARQLFIRLQGTYRIDRVVSLQGVSDKGRIALTHSLNADGYEFSLIVGAIIL